MERGRKWVRNACLGHTPFWRVFLVGFEEKGIVGVLWQKKEHEMLCEKKWLGVEKDRGSLYRWADRADLKPLWQVAPSNTTMG